MDKLLFILFLTYCGCASPAYLGSDIVITEYVVHKKADSLRIFIFPPRGVSIHQEQYSWLDVLRKEGLLKPDSILVDEIPKPITSQAPIYPEAARKNGLEGIVYLIAWIRTDGTVRKAAVVGASDMLFIEPALNVVMNWKFTPAILRGRFIEVSMIIPFKFKINQH